MTELNNPELNRLQSHLASISETVNKTADELAQLRVRQAKIREEVFELTTTLMFEKLELDRHSVLKFWDNKGRIHHALIRQIRHDGLMEVRLITKPRNGRAHHVTKRDNITYVSYAGGRRWEVVGRVTKYVGKMVYVEGDNGKG